MTPTVAYYANADEIALSKTIQSIVSNCKDIFRASGIYHRGRSNYNLYYARSGTTGWDEDIQTDGEFGGSMSLSVNVLKNALGHIFQMATSHPPAIDPVVVNSDSSSVSTVEIANKLIEYKLNVQKTMKIIDECIRQLPVLGASYLHGFWNPFAGGKLKQPEDDAAIPDGVQGVPRYDAEGNVLTPQMFRGDLCVEPLTLFDWFYDTSIQQWDADLQDGVARVYRNRYDLMVQYPDAAEALAKAENRYKFMMDEHLPSPSFATQLMYDSPAQKATVEVWIYYHKRTPAVPDGRMQVQLPDGSVLESGPLPEWVVDLPVHRLCPDPMIGGPHGYAAVTSSAGMQQALNMGASSVVTNMSAFSRKLIVAQKNMNIEARDLTGDLKYIEMEFNANGQPPIAALDLMGGQGNIIEVLQWLVGQIEQNTGANSIVRGDPKGVTAGVAINLYQSMALQFASELEGERVGTVAWYATHLVRSYQAHPNVQRDMQYTGEDGRSLLKDFYGKDLTGIDSFMAKMADPSTRTQAMRYNMATMLTQGGAKIEPDKLVHLVQTGDWKGTLKTESSINTVIRVENERLARNELVPVMPGDDPVLHVRGHLVVASDPELRNDPEKLAAWVEHMHQHANQMMLGDIFVKIAAGIVPMGPFPAPDENLAHGDTPAPSRGSPAAQPNSPQGGEPKGRVPGAKQNENAAHEPIEAPPVPGLPGMTP